MKSVIRIEHPSTGWGIFTNSNVEQGLEDKAGVEYLSNPDDFYLKHSKFPTPYEDKGIEHSPHADEFCAFRTLDIFNQWISSLEVKEFINMGFKIYLLDISSYEEGEFQVIYKKENITQMKDITHIFT